MFAVWGVVVVEIWVVVVVCSNEEVVSGVVEVE